MTNNRTGLGCEEDTPLEYRNNQVFFAIAKANCKIMSSPVRPFVCLIALFLCCSCAALSGRPIPLTASEEENAAEAFREIIASQVGCSDRLDADVSLSYKRLLFSGVVTGYLQAMTPAYLRFEGVNPFGLTEFLFGTDGDTFTLINVRGKKGYFGGVEAKELQRYLPGGMDFKTIYPWLVGRFPVEPFGDFAFERGINAEEYWLRLNNDNGRKGEGILFSVGSNRILQRIILTDSGASSIKFSYEYALLNPDKMAIAPQTFRECAIPERITINGDGRGELTINFNKNYPEPQFGPDDFSIDIPLGYSKELVK